MLSPVRNATSAPLDGVQDRLLEASTQLLQYIAAGRRRKPRPAGDVIDEVSQRESLDRSIVQMALVGLVRARKVKLTKDLEVTRAR